MMARVVGAPWTFSRHACPSPCPVADDALLRLEPSRDAGLGNPALLRGQWWQVMPGLERCSALNSPACFGSHGAKCCALLPSSALGFNERLRQVKGLQGDGQGVLDVRPSDAIGAVKIGPDTQEAPPRGLGRGRPERRRV